MDSVVLHLLAVHRVWIWDGHGERGIGSGSFGHALILNFISMTALWCNHKTTIFTYGKITAKL